MTDPASPSTTGDAHGSRVNRDPAVEAAHRAWDRIKVRSFYVQRVNAAREALKPIREWLEDDNSQRDAEVLAHRQQGQGHAVSGLQMPLRGTAYDRTT